MLFTPNLKGYWRFEGDANDNSGKGNNGTVVGATLAAGKFGRCYSFDGTDDYIHCGNAASVNITGAITLSAWVKITLNRANDIISKVNAAGYGYALIVGSDNQVLFLVSADGTSWGTLIVAGSLDSNWHHIAGVNSDSGGYLYIDGVVVGTDVTPATSIVEVAKNLEIGRYSRTIEDRYFQGLIDEPMIFNKALSQSDVKRVMLGLHPLNG